MAGGINLFSKYNFLDFSKELFFSISSDIHLSEAKMSIFYMRYISVFIYFSFIFFILCFLFFIKNDKAGRKFISFFRLSSLIILIEIFIYVFPFVLLKKYLYLLSILIYMILFLKFSELSMERLVKNRKYKGILRGIFYFLSIIFIISNFNFFILNKRILFLNKVNFFYYNYFFIIYTLIHIILIGVKIIILKKQGKTQVNKESKYYIVFYMLSLTVFILFKKEFFYVNCNFILLLNLLVMFMNYKISDFGVEVENNELKKVYLNICQKTSLLLIVALGINLVKLDIKITILLLIILVIQLIYFTITLFDQITEFNFYEIILKLKTAENLEIYTKIFEKEVKRVFNLRKCKMIIIKRDNKILLEKIKNYNFLTKNISMYGKTYSLGIKLNYLGKTIGYLLVDDPRILFYKKKLEDLKIFIRSSNYILDYLIIQEIKSEYEKSQKNNLENKVEVLENKIFYLEEYMKILKTKDDVEDIKKILDTLFFENKNRGEL